MRTFARPLAIPVLAALLLAACGDDDDTTSSGATTAAVTTAGTTAAATTAPPVTEPTSTAPATSAAEQPAADDVAEITVMVGFDSGPDRVENVRLGQDVVITMQSDQDEEYHLHGYELEQKAAAGVEATFSFTADKAGTFELESHVTEDVLLVLVVQ